MANGLDKAAHCSTKCWSTFWHILPMFYL